MGDHEYRGVAFPTTHWSMVDRARGGGAGLDDMLRRYWPALEAFLVWTLRVPRQDVEDVLQSFVADKVVAQRLMDHANRHRGRFRTFLISVLKHYVSNQRRWEKAQRRSPGTAMTDLAGLEVMDRGAVSPGIAFETAWVRQLLTDALTRMEAECAATQRQSTWALFDARVVQPALHSAQPPAYDDLVQRLGFAGPSEAQNALVTAKRMLARHLRDVVSQYARDAAEVDEELADLRQILSSPRA